MSPGPEYISMRLVKSLLVFRLLSMISVDWSAGGSARDGIHFGFIYEKEAYHYFLQLRLLLHDYVKGIRTV